MVLGVTGGYCAGKDAAVRELESHDISEINEDKIGHEALFALRSQVEEAFGARVIGTDGQVDRRALGVIVFSNPEALRLLESIVHPWMIEETRKRVSEAGDGHTMINAAILQRMGLHRLCDLVLQMEAPLLLRVYRGRKRDGQSIFRILRRIRSQEKHGNIDMPKQFLNEKGSDVDTVVVRNGGSRGALSRRLRKILTDYGLIGR